MIVSILMLLIFFGFSIPGALIASKIIKSKIRYPQTDKLKKINGARQKVVSKLFWSMIVCLVLLVYLNHKFHWQS